MTSGGKPQQSLRDTIITYAGQDSGSLVTQTHENYVPGDIFKFL